MSKKRKFAAYKKRKILRIHIYTYICQTVMSIKHNIEKRNCTIYDGFKLQFK